MIKLLVTPILRDGGKLEGIIYSNEDQSLLLLPKGLKHKTLMGHFNLLAHNEACSPEGSMGFLSPNQAIRFISEVAGEEVTIETSEEMKERVVLSEHRSVQGDWLDKLLMNTSRFNLSPEGNRARESLNKSAESRYAKTGKGKQSQQKYRLSEPGQASLLERRTRRKELNTSFREAQSWMEAIEGRTFQDWLRHKELLDLQDLEEGRNGRESSEN